MREKIVNPSIETTFYAHPISKGGTAAINVAGAAKNLRYIRRSELGAKFAKLDNNLKLPASVIPSTSITGNSVCIEGALTVTAGNSYTYNITNFDSFTTYVVASTHGSISISGNVITYIPLAGNAVGGFTVNGETFTVQVN